MSGKNARRRKRDRAKASYQRRLSGVATTVGVLYSLPSVVSAAIIHFSGTPVSIDAKAPDGLVPEPEATSVLFDNSVLWDVDGGGTPDFVLRRTGTVFVETGSTSYGAAQTIRSVEGYLHLDSGNNGNGVVMEYGGDPEPQDIAKLSNNVIPNVLVGPAMMGPMGSGSYVFGAPGQTGRMMMSFNSSTSSIGGQYNYGLMNANVVGAAYNGRFNQAPGSLNYFGFSFTEGGDTFYGWAAILFDLEGEDRRLEIVEWAYEDTPDTAIAVGATGVPVPAHGLAMLAAGAGSVLAMRRKRRDLALIPRTSDRDTL